MNNLFYTGVGARKTPDNVLRLMESIAKKLSSAGYVLRSGGAKGADSAFESGAGLNKQIFHARNANSQAMEIVRTLHPAWNRCSEFVRKLHGRNAFQVLGKNLDNPSHFMICWTPDGCLSHQTRSYKTGGTGTAISVASIYNVPIFNLADKEHFRRLQQFVT